MLQLLGTGKGCVNRTPLTQPLTDKSQRASVQPNSHQSSGKATSRMGKNLYHLDIWQRLSKIYKKRKQKNKPNLKWSIKLNREISKQEIQRANKYVFKYSISLAIRDTQMKTTLRFHFTPVKITMVFFKDHKCWCLCEKAKHIHCWWEYKLVLPLCNSVWGPLES